MWGEDLEGGACSHNLYTFGPRPRVALDLYRVNKVYIYGVPFEGPIIMKGP